MAIVQEERRPASIDPAQIPTSIAAVKALIAINNNIRRQLRRFTTAMAIDTDDAKTFHGKYRPDINGLRAIAVVAVVLNHFDRTLLPLGYLGVDIFFVISGFVITSSIYHRPESSLFEFWLAFFSRRFKRLFPALGACVLITSILVCLVDPHPVESLRTGLSSLFGLSNLHMYRQAIDYFGSRADLNAFTQTWSLGVEEQFYLVFPVAIWATGFLRASVRASKPLITVLSIASLASLVFYVYSAARKSTGGLFSSTVPSMGTRDRRGAVLRHRPERFDVAACQVDAIQPCIELAGRASFLESRK